MQEVKVYDDGRLCAIKTYKNGKITNIKEYNIDEKLMVETPYRNGKEHGAQKYYDKDGNLQGVKQYKNGIRHGVDTWFYTSGRIKHETYFKYGFIQQRNEYYRSGAQKAIIPYKNGVEHGNALYLREDGTAIESIEYSGGQRNGYNYIYHEDGITLKEIYPCLNGYWHGVCKTFNKEGEPVGKFKSVKKLADNKPAPTLTTRLYYHSRIPRTLNQREYCLCGSYPLDYKFTGHSYNFYIAMSVPPIMIANIAYQIRLQWLDKL